MLCQKEQIEMLQLEIIKKDKLLDKYARKIIELSDRLLVMKKKNELNLPQ